MQSQNWLTVPTHSASTNNRGTIRKDAVKTVGQDQPKYIQELDATLCVLRDDLAEWVNNLLHCEPALNASNFFSRLSDGVLLCQVAQVIHDAAQKQKFSVPSELPVNKAMALSRKGSRRPIGIPMVSSSMSRPDIQRNIRWQVHCRVNVETFLRWCRECGVNPVLLFDTNGLINQSEKRNILLTMYAVSRMGCLYDIARPQLVTFEEQVDLQQQQVTTSWSSDYSSGFSELSSSVTSETQPSESWSEVESVRSWDECDNGDEIRLSASSIPEDLLITTNSLNSEFRNSPSRFMNVTPTLNVTRRPSLSPLKTQPLELTDSTVKSLTPADERVLSIVSQCRCSRYPKKVWKHAEGVYRIGVKLVFMRLLRECCMVRVGGGWEELSEFMRSHKLCHATPVLSTDGKMLRCQCRDDRLTEE